MRRFTLIISILLCFLLTACAEEPSQSPSPSSSQSAQGGGGQKSPGSEQSAKMIQSKQLISKDDATKILGESLKEGVEEDQSAYGMSSCFYAPENSDSKSYLIIAILQKVPSSSSGEQSGGQSGGGQSGGGQSGGDQSGGDQSGGKQKQLSPKKVFETLKKVLADPNTPVTGFIGDDKFLMSQGMSILSGENYIFISAGNADPAKVEQILKQAGEIAVSNLKRVQDQGK